MVETPSAAPVRLFLALWPEPYVRDALAAWQESWRWPPHASRVRPERLHLTLHFLGDVAAQRLAGLQQSLRVPFSPFELRFGRGQVWLGGIAALTPHEMPPALVQLHCDLAQRLRAENLPLDPRPYRAHVTMARRATGAKVPATDPALSWRADAGYVLVRSLPGGAGYEVLQRFD